MTRRGMLSVTSALYDPLGLVAPVTLLPKLMLQDMCRVKLDWDDEVGESQKARWSSWLEDLPLLNEVRIPRCFKPTGLADVFHVELHHFCDASEYAYGAASYIKIYDGEGTVRSSLVMGKARVC